jgi:hypothetical protein
MTSPKPIVTPAWVAPYISPLSNATITSRFADIRPWSLFGIEGKLYVGYTPAEHFAGSSTIRFTFRDRGTPPFYATTPAYEYRFDLEPVNDAPVALSTTFIADGASAAQGTPFIGRLRYYDIELSQKYLNVSLSPELGYYDPTVVNATNASYIKTSNGLVELLPANTQNATLNGTEEAIMFRYTPSGAYAPSDSFTFFVYDGSSTSQLAVVQIVDPKATTSATACKLLNLTSTEFKEAVYMYIILIASL